MIDLADYVDAVKKEEKEQSFKRGKGPNLIVRSSFLPQSRFGPFFNVDVVAVHYPIGGDPDWQQKGRERKR